jgi:hypothetical protein
MAEPASNVTPAAHAPGARWRRIGSWVLLVVFCLGLVASLVAVWTRTQVLETDAWVETVTPLAADPAIQAAIADRVTTLLAERIQRDGAAQSGGAGLAGGAAMAMVLDYVEGAVLDYVQSAAFQEFWVAANEAAHRRTIDALTSNADGPLFLEDGQLVLDLSPAVAQVEERLRAAGLDVVDRIQIDPARATFVLFESETLRRAQEGIELLDTLAIVLPVVTLLAFAGCLLVATDRVRMLTRAGVGTAVTMVLALVVLAVVRSSYLDTMGSGRNVDALAAAFDIVLRTLREALRITAITGLMVAGVGALVSSSLIRRPQVVMFVARYRAAFIGGILAIACVALVAVDHVSAGLAIGVGLLALVAVLVVAWLARLPVIAPAAADGPS